MKFLPHLPAPLNPLTSDDYYQGHGLSPALMLLSIKTAARNGLIEIKEV